MNDKTAWLMGVLAIIIVASVVFTDGFGILGTPTVTGAGVNTEGVVSIPMSDISETARFYEYDYGGTTIRFFAVKASDGSVKTGFDACDVCYGSGKGYRQEGGYMVCNNCGNRYPINGLGTENKNPGGCWPGYLPSLVEGDGLVVKKSDLANGAWRFA
ncbi:MAG: DUF2318 domain-containing protein [Candidatus Aenigmarchaeota archaeon]|nr:DUF2318 domain-containing protein [Candidatus Aenigmarchaeota archaeon]